MVQMIMFVGSVILFVNYQRVAPPDPFRIHIHPRQISSPPEISIFEGMVGSPHLAQGTEGSILALGGASISTAVILKSSSTGVSRMC